MSVAHATAWLVPLSYLKPASTWSAGVKSVRTAEAIHNVARGGMHVWAIPPSPACAQATTAGSATQRKRSKGLQRLIHSPQAADDVPPTAPFVLVPAPQGVQLAAKALARAWSA